MNRVTFSFPALETREKKVGSSETASAKELEIKWFGMAYHIA